ncbi:MAG: SpoIIE family protein phosphatase, partial [Chloroflexi bacterium]|nr:SpoIIE family protein phosphatase [Chloroflexota bacterium]
PEAAKPAERGAPGRLAETAPVDIAPGDPLLAYFQQAAGAVEIDRLELASPALAQLKAAGVKLVVPLISQGELIGLLNLGPRLSEQEYSTDDKQLLEKLAAQASPAVRVAQLVREQEAEVRARERIEQELRVAQLIQQQFLPKHVPDLPGWQVAAFYRAAQEVGGDFYDFVTLDAGRIGLVVGDVTGHGVPAALVMATTRSFIRAQAARAGSPSEVLAQANDFLHADIPQNMFVTCLYAVLDPQTGRLVFANAGHDLPFVRTASGLQELRATGMPLGLMPGMRYDEHEFTLSPGDTMLLHSDGLAEAHAPDREMFGFPRVKGIVASKKDGKELIDDLMSALHRFTGPAWEQEDDITLVTVSRSANALAEKFQLPSQPGKEREVMERVAEIVRPLGIPKRTLERLKTAVSEAAMNAIEHGNKGDPDLPVTVQITARDGKLSIAISDRGGGRQIPEAQTPDLEAKLAGLQKPRGWGLFLIKNMVDDMKVTTDDVHHTVELMYDLGRARKETGDAGSH